MKPQHSRAYFLLLTLVVFTLITLLMLAAPITRAAQDPPATQSKGQQSSGSDAGQALPLRDEVLQPTGAGVVDASGRTDGALQILTADKSELFCPLKHTDVRANVSGFLARVTVTQEFVNPTSDKVEAIYVFPLPNNSAVDDMTLLVGGRTIRGLIKERSEAQKIYQQARQSGHTAALLDQERPNIFTQSVANIPPGSNVKVEISYIEQLKYEAGSYEFVFPMVVGPRYIPGAPTGKQSGGWAPDTDRVPDASRITPPVAGVHYGAKGTRAGHDISLAVNVDAGVTIHQISSSSHKVEVQNHSARSATVTLASENEIPNRDFILRYDVAGKDVQDALLTYSKPAASGSTKGSGAAGGGGEFTPNDGYFTFILQPPDRVNLEDATPREMIFVLDTSGSMGGFPIETAKKTMTRAINNMRPQDTFNLITFSGDEHILFPQAVPASAANLQQATRFLAGTYGSGGTEMMKAIRAALGDDAARGFSLPVERKCGPANDCASSAAEGKPVRIVVFMTDGFVGNDMEILAAIQKHPEARVFSFGIGTSVNRFLLDGMARYGRGEAEYITRQEDAEAAADRFYERVHTPVLTDINIDWGNLPVSDVIPAKPLDLFTAKPLAITGRYTGGGSGTIRITGLRAGKPFERSIKVNLPEDDTAEPQLAHLWARNKIEQLMASDWNGIQQQTVSDALKQQITQLGLDYRLMTQFTSFVAVEEQTVVDGGKSRTVYVPVEMPQGVSVEGVFGESKVAGLQQITTLPVNGRAVAGTGGGVGYGTGGGVGYRTGGGISAPPPTITTNGQIGRVDQTVDVTAQPVAVNVETSELSLDDQEPEMPNAVPLRETEAHREKRERDAAARLAKDQKLRSQMAARLNPALLQAWECWVKAGRKGNANCAGLKNGKLMVQVWPQGEVKSIEARLAAVGLATSASLNNGAPGAVTGTIAIEKLEQLAALPEVKLIALAK